MNTLQGRDPEHTYEHHPLCDDNGWDHRGPCVIETETEHEYDVSCLIELYGETPADAVATYLAVVRDFLAGRIEWLSVDTVDRETGERTTVRVTPHDVPAVTA